MKPNKANDFHDVAQKLNVNQFWHAVTCGVAVVKYRYSGRIVCHEKMWTNVQFCGVHIQFFWGYILF